MSAPDIDALIAEAHGDVHRPEGARKIRYDLADALEAMRAERDAAFARMEALEETLAQNERIIDAAFDDGFASAQAAVTDALSYCLDLKKERDAALARIEALEETLAQNNRIITRVGNDATREIDVMQAERDAALARADKAEAIIARVKRESRWIRDLGDENLQYGIKDSLTLGRARVECADMIDYAMSAPDTTSEIRAILSDRIMEEPKRDALCRPGCGIKAHDHDVPEQEAVDE